MWDFARYGLDHPQKNPRYVSGIFLTSSSITPCLKALAIKCGRDFVNT
jgi:hypothetical protein